MAFQFTDAARYRFRRGCVFLGLDQDNHETGILPERHCLVVGGARSGKGAAILIPNARRWEGTVLCIDPKGENAEHTFKQREAMGQAVHVLDPFHKANVPERLRAAFNPLAAIDPKSRTARADVQAVGDGLIVNHNEGHMEWTSTARSILSGICAYVINAYEPEHRTFRTVRQLLTQPDQVTDINGQPILDENGEPQGLYITAQRMLDHVAFGGIIRQAAQEIIAGITANKGVERDALSQAKRHTSWLDDDPIADTLDHSTFSLSDLKTGAASIYVVIPPEYLKTASAYLRLFVQCAISAMAKGGQNGARCLFLLDEFFALGKLDDIEMAVGLLPSYGVHLMPFVQNLGQLYKLYGKEGATTYLTNSDAVIFFGNVGDQMALEYMSRRIGPLTPDEIAAAPPEPEPFNPLPQPVPEAFKGQLPPSSTAATAWIGDVSQAQRDSNSVSNENAVRNWQAANTREEAAHRAAEDAKMREWATNNAAAQEEHNARQRARQAVYDHHMRQVNQPRLTPSEIERMTGKPDGAQVALSMIVFAKAGDTLNLLLAPYFRQTPPVRQSQPRATPAPLVTTTPTNTTTTRPQPEAAAFTSYGGEQTRSLLEIWQDVSEGRSSEFANIIAHVAPIMLGIAIAIWLGDALKATWIAPLVIVGGGLYIAKHYWEHVTGFVLHTEYGTRRRFDGIWFEYLPTFAPIAAIPAALVGAAFSFFILKSPILGANGVLHFALGYAVLAVLPILVATVLLHQRSKRVNLITWDGQPVGEWKGWNQSRSSEWDQSKAARRPYEV